MASLPLQPSEAVQLVALVEVHVSVDGASYLTVLGLAANEVMAGGIALTDTVAD